MSKNLRNIWPDPQPNISSLFKPSATLEEVVKDTIKLTKQFSKKDHLIVIGGSNNEIHFDKGKLVSKFDNLLKVTRHTNVIIAALPYKHNSPGLNNKVSILNMDMKTLTDKAEHAKFLPLQELPRHLYTKYGSHFNRQGKMKIANMIKTLISSKSQSNQ